MANLVIVAIPSEDDYVNKISSEKVPHMTLLMLGDASKVQNLDRIVSFVQFSAEQSLTRFGLSVDHRGVLGADSADVLFFRQSGCCYEDVNTFRSYLLQNKDIRMANNSVDQFETWNPHLTLGYPESPANPDNRDYPGTHYVTFDKIAVWNQDYSGFEFLLKSDDDYVMMSIGETVVKELLHISEKPWSDYSEADYTLAQWHRACLIHQHDGPPTSKDQCKLPVRTPDGALNRNGVHAALAALHGARTPLKASADEKAKAEKALISYYKQLGEDVPSSLMPMVAQSAIDHILIHHGADKIL